MAQRRFTDEEIAEILARATRPLPAPTEGEGGGGRGRAGGGDREAEGGDEGDPVGASPPAPRGLTLAELRSVAREAGIDPARIDDAALEVTSPGTPVKRRSLVGLTRGLSREAALPGPLRDEAWERLLAHLRATWEARGEVAETGLTRSWSTDEVELHMEPDPASTSGWRLRIASESEDGEMLEFSLFAAALAPVLLALYLLGVGIPGVLVGLALLASAGMTGWCAWALPRWAREEEERLEGTVIRARRLAADLQPDPQPDTGPAPEPPTPP